MLNNLQDMLKGFIGAAIVCIILGFGWPEFVFALPIPPEFWDNCANAGWGVLPLVLTGVAVAVLVSLREWRTKCAAEVVELGTRSAMNDALMWQARHAAKAQRKAL